jgi:hypothetical protein
MGAWTWLAWPDPIVDFGREAYVPWRLASGATLYRDVAWWSGPLSPYWNALWFRAFGASLATLYASNALVAIAVCALLHRLLARVGDGFGATAACLLFVLLFACAQFVGIGNYNWIAPYAHELTHGTLLTLLGLACLWGGAPGGARFAGAGLCLGLVFLTKVEVFAAAGAALGAGALLRAGPAQPASRVLARLGLFAAGAAAPVAAAFALLAAALPASEALAGTLGGWPALLGAQLAGTPFYRAGLGSDDPLGNAGRMALWLGVWALVLGPWLVAARLPAARRLPAAPALAGAAAATLVLLWLVAGPARWIEAVRPLPVIVLALALGRALHLRGSRDAPRDGLALCLLLFGGVLLAKMALHVRLVQYGFALAMPATLLVALWLLSGVPAWIDARGGRGALFRGAALGFLGVLVLAHLGLMQRQLARKTYRLGAGPDTIRTDPIRGGSVARALAEVERKSAPDGTLLVAPEGVLLNFLARRRSPTPHINLMPPELRVFGEERIAADLAAAPADLVLLVHKDTAEYGARWFGRDYGRAILAAIERTHERDQRIGGPPFQEGTAFGIEVWVRRR